MNREYEVVRYGDIKGMKAFVVSVSSRTAHAHKETEIGFILEGSGELIHSGRSAFVKKGDAYVLNPMEMHEVRGAKGLLVFAVQLSERLIGSLFSGYRSTYFDVSIINDCFDSATFSLLSAYAAELAHEYFEGKQNYEYRCIGLMNLILYQIYSFVPKKSYSDSELTVMKRDSARLNRILGYIDGNFKRKLLLDEIAREEGLSMSYLSHFFKDKVGMSFQNYLGCKRFECACRLLIKEKKSVLAAAIESGFSDVRYLNEYSRRYFGCPANRLRMMTSLKEAGNLTGISNSEVMLESDSAKEHIESFRQECRGKISGLSAASVLFS